MTEIEIIGPYRHRIFAWTDQATGEVHPERWVTILAAEALGSDGQMHTRELACGIEVMLPVVAEVRAFLLKKALRDHMKELGVWAA